MSEPEQTIERREPKPDSALLPCPFCGSPPGIGQYPEISPRREPRTVIWCPEHEAGGCHVGPGVTGETRAEAVSRWNVRATASQPNAAIERAITIWPFSEAPRELRALSENGGDEDWLAVFPVGTFERSEIEGFAAVFYPPLWLNEESFGCSGVSRHLLPDGRLVLIGAHA